MSIKNTIIDLFSEQVKKSPDSIAVVFGDLNLTYNELDEKSNQLAHYLIKEGVKVETLVPICINRSFEMIIGILGILKAGGAYVPIDPNYPKDRINYILEDIESDFVLTSNKSNKYLSGKQIIFEEITQNVILQKISQPEILLTSENLAYIIYTSGSTGKPKGVMIEHRSLLSFIDDQIKYFDITENERILQFSSFCFDASVEQIFLALTSGAVLTLIEEQTIKNHVQFAALLNKHEITHLHATPGFLDNLNPSDFHSLKRVIAGGDVCKRELFKKWSGKVDFYNEYGPTETTVTAIEYKCTDKEVENLGIIPIGKGLKNVSVYILNEELSLVQGNQSGEIFIGGNHLARGYHNLPDLTNEFFIDNPFISGEKLYKTGDIGRWLENGDVEFLGRIDDQVKIRGYRIELGEIENAIIENPSIKQCVVLAQEYNYLDKRLVAYIVQESTFKKEDIINYLLTKLPDYMVPALWVIIDNIPLTTNGKIDKKALVNPDASELLTNIYVAPKSQIEKHIAEIWKSTLNVMKVGLNDNFFELGGNSLLAQKLILNLKADGFDLSITKLYQYLTVSGISKHLEKQSSESRFKKLETKKSSGDIAVIGMAGRFPGANNVDELWDLLIDGRETTTFFNDEEIDSAVPIADKMDDSYVKARGIIEGATLFDPSFFGINPKIAELMDPQQRVFLEISREVLEKTGHLPNKFPYKLGVYAGAGTNTYFEHNVLSHPDLINNVGKVQVYSVNEKDYIASRTAYHLDLKGPAVSINSACSTSLLAIAEAVNSLRAGQCDAAIAGGSSITSPINSGHLYQEGSMLSADGHCKPFDNEATGTVFSDGAGVVLLKRLEDAKRDGNLIYALIKGIGVNNDGSGKGSFTAPSSEGQADAIKTAIENAGIEAANITYIEAHGTGTPIGDPIEFEGLLEAFGKQDKKQFCGIGSIKSNFGHLTQAAGVAGFIKTCLALYYKKLPPSIGFSAPNKNINFLNSPFYVNNKLTNWDKNKNRIAGVSSFGVGGTNVHVILEEFENGIRYSAEDNPKTLITWSANSEESNKSYANALKNYVESNQDVKLDDIAYTLNKSRSDFRYRKFIVTGSSQELIEALNKSAADNSYLLKETPGEIVFNFPGQGVQYLNMGIELYKQFPVYKNAIDECAEILEKYIGEDIKKIIFPEEISDEANLKLKDTRWTQPALFVTEYALAKLWISFGIKPTLFCGHSIGEYVAAHLAGVFSLEDGLKLISARGFLISKLPNGSMLSVRENVEVIKDFLTEDLCVAAINTPKLTVIAGPTDQINNLSKLIDTKDLPNKLLFTSHAFHSSMMDPILEDFKKIVSSVKLSEPKITMISTLTGKKLSNEEALSADYWTLHLRKPVLFSKAIENILNYNSPLFLEIGPGVVTSTLVKQIAASLSVQTNSLTSISNNQDEYTSILKTLGQLWAFGAEPNLDFFFIGDARTFLNLPTYQFDRKKYWVDIKTQNNGILPKEIHNNNNITNHSAQTNFQNMRNNNLVNKVKQILEDASGIEIDGIPLNQSFIEIGLDSLLLTQVAISLKREFSLPITFRKLNEDYPSIDALVDYLDKNIPEEIYTETLISQSALSNNDQKFSLPSSNHNHTVGNQVQFTGNSYPVNDGALGLIAQQLEILSKQVLLMQGVNPVVKVAVPSTTEVQKIATQNVEKTNKADSDLSKEEKAEIQKPFGATPKIERHSTDLNSKQAAFLKQLTEQYNDKTSKSKQYTSSSRSYMADPRVVTGFRTITKELVYPIVINRSSGSKLWDLDGNQYIDVLNGFGSNMLGYQPDVIKEAMHAQIEKGYEVGPQHELAAEVSKMICDFTGFERAALCSTGSEAVLGCIRIARTVSGRPLIVAFTGSYHGIVDEVLVRGTKKLKSFPAAAGIMPEAVHNILVLDYGTDESLAIIRERANEIAAVLVEPIQSRRPEFVPIDFLKEVREITKQSGTVLIFDEVITGFRMHPGGAQALFGIKADLASYGKVVGAGIPIGVIAGNSYLMDALDGGNWNYGDSSFPEIGVTYFAGTFVRHPLALASAKASLSYMKEMGPGLQEKLNEKGKYLSGSLNAEFEKRQLPMFVANYGSLWKIKFHEEIPLSELLFVLMRQKGIHILDGFPCFITEATSYDDIEIILLAFIESLDEMVEANIFPSIYQANKNFDKDAIVADNNNPPVNGAKLGKDREGNPAWFIKDPNQDGKYLQIDLN